MILRRREIGLALTGALWSLAGALLYVDLHILPASVDPLASGLADGSAALIGLSRAASRVLLPSLAAYGLLAVIPGWYWRRFELRQVAPLALLFAFVAAGPLGVRAFILVVAPLAAALAALAYQADRADKRTRRWFYFVLPATISGASIVGALYVWLNHYPLREQAGSHPAVAWAFLSVACLIVALPALVYIKTPAVRVLLLVAGAWFVSRHSFDPNLPIEPAERIVGAAVERPGIILIVVDTLRADALSYRNEAAPPTPFIDSLASESIVFSNAISPSPWTLPAMTSLMTGLAPLESRDPELNAYSYRTVSRPTLAESLKAHGYRTRGIVGNHLLYRPLRVAAGLQRIETYSNNTFGESGVWGILTGWRETSGELHSLTTRRLTDQAIEYAQRLPEGEPSFLWLHYFDPHGPYLPPREYLERMDGQTLTQIELQRRLYLGEVRFVDSEIGRFLKALRQKGAYDSSIIVFTSDHGEGFFEHGYSGHGYDLYQELLHVPLLIRLPGGAVRKTVTEYVPTNSVLPTILGLVDIDEPSPEGVPPSLTPLIDSADASYEHPIVSGANNLGEPQWSIVKGPMKYVYREHSGRQGVYDLTADPSELRLLERPPEPFFSEAREALNKHLNFAQRTLREEGLTRDSSQEQELIERMKSLGYIQ